MEQRRITHLLEQYRRGPRDLARVMEEVPAEAWHFSPAKGNWTAHQVVFHLVDTECQSFVRFRSILAEPGCTIPNHDEKSWVKRVPVETGRRVDAMRLVTLIRGMNLQVLAALPPSSWRLAGEHSVRGRVTLLDLLDTYTSHIQQHIRQIKRNCESYAERRAHL
jgi:hypothetical protein